MLTSLLIIVPAILLVLTLLSRIGEEHGDIAYEPDEHVIYAAYRHWTVIFFRCLLIAMVAALFFAAAAYRAVGGSMVVDAIAPRGNDLFNYMLIVVFLIILGVGGQQAYSARKKKHKLPMWERMLFYILFAALLFTIAFRYDGGRIFNIDRASAAGLDVLNGLLIGMGLLLCAFGVYTYFDLRDDSLVLTNLRVLRREVQEIPILGDVFALIFRRPIVIREYVQQVVLEDIQQVNVKQESYFEFYLWKFFEFLERFGVKGYQRYGTIVVQSLSFVAIRFDDASGPVEMQKKILNRVQDVNRNETPDMLLRRTLEEQVWGQKTPAHRKIRRHNIQQTAGLFSWLFPPNPEYQNDAKQTIIWRPSWVFIFWRMLRAILTLVGVLVAAAVVSAYSLIDGALLMALAIPLIAGSCFWMWWIYDTYQHDRYILTDERIIDEDKSPFGPTNRREAELRSIQNVLFEEGFVEGLLNYGDVIIRTGGAGGGDFTFYHIPSPREVQAQINTYVVDFRRREQEKNRRQTIQALTQYHILQDKHDELFRTERVDQMIGTTMRNVTSTISTQPDEAATREVLSAARAEAKASARRELYAFVRRFLRRQSRGRA
ncbi:PH domain-containing protein [Chloroflexia bacterium SDU3-3]|nr:PH domain-containing protein [Chloroflexia bacterium SDU3-3]